MAGSLACETLTQRTRRDNPKHRRARSGRPGWFADPAKVPGGAFIDEGIADCDRARWLVGSEVVQVEAKTANFVHKDVAPLEDWGFAIFSFAFFLLAAERLVLAFIAVQDETQSLVYLIRLAAYLFILWAIIDKNRASSPSL